ncbi:dTDP-4-dehydrorhamnose 3,5-epimerase [Alkalihalobacillus sp. CinArs1]|uniref:dTDP-4-dehydrorhamnose 3,5-epimerase n=1 Tax=Alkalihalobacillus sp. CinArs1 TaxID=2995314 RepID=UPI0022DCE6C7|nr:dTDP-4-dehydrorhamnose 3,5-epimerase [Alkalihalobacillus sp. CinArs1]
MKVIDTKLSGVKIIEPDVFGDDRGYFLESYNQETFLEHGLDYTFVQDNHSLSKERGVIRGLHYQEEPYAQTKLVRVIAGSIYDVAVDIRKNSKTYGHWIGLTLSEKNHRQLLIPQGFAHGFCTLEANTQVLYKVDHVYSPEHERGIVWNDPYLGITWPTATPILSEKDTGLPFLKDVTEATRR